MNVAVDSSALVADLTACWTPLPDKPEETPEAVVRSLWLSAAGSRASLKKAMQMDLPALDSEAAVRLRQLLERRKSGVPLAHLTERQSFLGLELVAGSGALIPRSETEILGRAALTKISALAQERGSVRVIDVCTGSGNLALSYAHFEPRAVVYAADLSREALDVARKNLRHTRLGRRVEFRHGDLLAPFDSEDFLGSCDFLSCNPPYIPSAKVPAMDREISGFEPKLAFDGGIYGVSVLTKLLRDAPRFLKPASWLGFEVGLGQGPALARRLGKSPAFAEVEPYRDGAGEIRALLARTR